MTTDHGAFLMTTDVEPTGEMRIAFEAKSDPDKTAVIDVLLLNELRFQSRRSEP